MLESGAFDAGCQRLVAEIRRMVEGGVGTTTASTAAGGEKQVDVVDAEQGDVSRTSGGSSGALEA